MKIFRTALAVFLLGATVAPVSLAREINSNPARQDAVSFHGGNPACYSAGYVSGCEVAVDDLGNFLPTVSNAQDLGTSALPFRALYLAGAESAGTAGTMNSAGTGGTAATSSVVNGLSVLGLTQIGLNDAATVGGGVTASTTVPVNSSYEQVIGGCAGACTLTSKPEISTTTIIGGTTLIPTGTLLTITSSATVTDAVIFTSSATGTFTGVALGAATRSVYAGHVLSLIFNAALDCWLELSYR